MAKKLILIAVIAVTAWKFAGVHPQSIKQDLDQDIASYSQMSARTMMGWGQNNNWGK